MKKVILLFLVLTTLSFSLDKVILTSGEWEPFASSKNKNARIGEILVEEAFKSAGVDVEFVYFPWKRSYELTKSAKYDGSILWSDTKERKEEVLFSKEAIVDVKIVFFHRKDFDFDWSEIDDLKKYKIGGTLGYAEGIALKEEGLNVEMTTSEDLNFKKLIAGRIDVYPTSLLVGHHIMNGIFTSEKKNMIKTHKLPIKYLTSSKYLLVSKKHPQKKEILNAFDKGMKELRESGRYDELLNKALELE